MHLSDFGYFVVIIVRLTRYCSTGRMGVFIV